MFCSKCGKEIPPGAKFCAVCGTPILGQTEVNTTVNEESFLRRDRVSQPLPNNYDLLKEDLKKSKHKKKSKIKMIFAAFFVMVLFLAGACGYFYFTSPIKDVMAAIDYQDYEEAVDIYNAEVNGNKIYREMCAYLLKDKLNTVENDFMEDSISYEDACKMLQAMQDLYNNSLATIAEGQLEKLQDLNESKVIFEQAEELSEAGNVKEALELYQQVAEEMPDYESVQQKIDECRSIYKGNVLTQTEGIDKQEEYKTALDMVSVALKVLGEDADLVKRYEELTEAYHVLVKEEAMLLANDGLEKKNYAEALTKVQAALKILPEDADLNALFVSINSVYTETLKEEIKKDVEEAANAGNYPQAISVLKEAVKEYSEDEALNTQLNTILSTYETVIANQVADFVANDDYAGALNLISEAMKVSPESIVLATLYQETEANQPVKLNELTISEYNEYFEVTGMEVTEDTIGNVYSPGNLFVLNHDWYDTSYAKYYLGKQYKTLKFTVAIKNINDRNKDTRRVTVYGDDEEILYTSGELARTTAPYEVDVDVSKVDWLYIHSDSTGYGITPILVNPILYK